ncbi:alpha-(1-_6)-mannopyranosyltransferase A [Corynebacterium yudongzhengii]|uniref:Alpha-(1->6)-mannopyranosyltransferase A n=1 Tax=Corynebacterium yudongzhengii TaxID=2080740 RepID=A0A2U1T790_9CORY|nr:alpha-(1->6)-mannopyranosyltransferase A [Corynebacterium yudongzhengii]AWB81558.1 alpha-(1->6)-mannopyranosyltransferase A [Corynebacterium yudongzhengii]PWC01871.1 alpha-(1->6)-mannopyranosyltransferase A [Corynebacterium yudongzhengii]
MSTASSVYLSAPSTRRDQLAEFFSRFPGPLLLGALGALALALSSHGAGATRNRGGVLEALGLEYLSFGHGAALMNALFNVGLIAMVLAWVFVGRRVIVDTKRSDPGRLRTVRKALLSWCAPLIIAAPILSRDVYSYLMQGAMVRDGFDPYNEGAAVNPGPYLLEVSHDWRNTTTPYGPLHLWIGEGVTTAVGDNVTAGVIAYKFISLAGFIAIAFAVEKIAARLGGDPALALWLGVANPVMVFHMVGGMHNESVMVGLVSLGLLACLHRRFVLGVALISVAVSLKATAAVALPFVVWMATFHYAPKAVSLTRRIFTFVVVGLLGVVETLTVVAAVTWLSGSSWGWLSEITGNSKVINPLAGPTFIAEIATPFVQLFDPDFDYNVILQAVRPVFSVLMLLGLALTWWIFRGGDRRSIMGTTAAYQVAFVLNSVTLPWYYASSVSLVGTFTPPRWLLKLVTGLSIIVALSFTGSGNHQLYNAVWMVAVTAAAWVLTTHIFPLDLERRPGHQHRPDPIAPRD